MVWSPVLHTGQGCPPGGSPVSGFDFIEDLGYDYFGFKTLEKSYLLKVNGILAYWCFRSSILGDICTQLLCRSSFAPTAFTPQL